MKDSRTYSKRYKSETYQENISYHGSPRWKDHQRACKEDKNLREEIKSRFGIYNGDLLFGFDGKLIYFFTIKGHPQELEDTSKNVPYDAKVQLLILGKESDLEFPQFADTRSDLEHFILNHGFKRIEKD